jgi:hypothetical protein
MPNRSASGTSRSRNVLALAVSAVSLTIIGGSFDPAPAGEDLNLLKVSAASSNDVPLPPDASTELAIDQRTSIAAPLGIPAPGGMMLNSDDAMKFSLLMLQDGARFVENTNTYTLVFHKQERLGGDLGKSQSIEMKVRHEPSFSVYMKWLNGDKGRQVLYSDEYEDGKMVVKLGGIRGRLLPGIKVDPNGTEAMKEARYPVTEAGLLGMLRQIIAHRQNDMKNGEGVTCRRLPNTVFDERECYAFEYEYHSQRFNPMYRKSLILLDCRYHIPLQVVNHTWARDTEGLSPEQLDAQTLVENYSFTQIDFGRDLLAVEFDRDNPAYRM